MYKRTGEAKGRRPGDQRESKKKADEMSDLFYGAGGEEKGKTQRVPPHVQDKKK